MRTVVAAICVACCLGSSCGDSDGDAQPALSVRGSLEAAPSAIKNKHIPALLFSDGVSRLCLQELEAHGMFPRDLDLVLWQPPPEAALRSVGHLDEPRIAVGYLTAVADLHPDTLRFTTTTTRDERCESSCEVTERWCAGDFECYSEQTTCPDADSEPDACELHSRRGDAELKQPRPWARFAGLSTNYVFVYVSEALAAGSVTASLLAAPNGLAVGYHILAMRDLSESESSERTECWNGALEAAVDQLNQADDTSYQWHDVMRPCADENSWSVTESALCALPQGERDATRARLEALSWRTRFARGCQLAFRTLQPTAADQPLYVKLSNDSAPVLVQLL